MAELAQAANVAVCVRPALRQRQNVIHFNGRTNYPPFGAIPAVWLGEKSPLTLGRSSAPPCPLGPSSLQTVTFGLLHYSAALCLSLGGPRLQIVATVPN